MAADGYQFPILPSNALNTGNEWDVICPIDLTYGGIFIKSKHLPVERIPDVFELLAAFVEFDESD